MDAVRRSTEAPNISLLIWMRIREHLDAADAARARCVSKAVREGMWWRSAFEKKTVAPWQKYTPLEKDIVKNYRLCFIDSPTSLADIAARNRVSTSKMHGVAHRIDLKIHEHEKAQRKKDREEGHSLTGDSGSGMSLLGLDFEVENDSVDDDDTGGHWEGVFWVPDSDRSEDASR